MDFNQTMCEYGIALETIMEDIKKTKLSEIIESIPPRHGKAHFAVPLLYAMIQWGDINYGEFLERIENEHVSCE